MRERRELRRGAHAKRERSQREARERQAVARAARRPREVRARDARATGAAAARAARRPREARARDARATGMSAGSAKGRLKSGAAAALMREANDADSGSHARGRSAECAREAQLLEVAAHWALASRRGQKGGPALRASMSIT